MLTILDTLFAYFQRWVFTHLIASAILVPAVHILGFLTFGWAYLLFLVPFSGYAFSFGKRNPAFMYDLINRRFK